MTTIEHPVHPAAELFPLIEGEDFAELVEDIRLNGLTEPITRTPDGRILDGRNRYRACRVAGVEPAYQEHDGDPWAFVVSRNLHRRHLTGPQRAMIAARLAERAHGSNRYTTKTAGKEETSTGDSSLPAETRPEAIPTQREAAALLNTSTTSAHRARVIVREGIEELGQVVDEGRVELSTAERVARLDGEQQTEFVNSVRSGAKPSAVAPPSRKPRKESCTTELNTEEGGRLSAPLATKRYYRRSEVVSRDAVFEVVTALAGYDMGLRDTTSVDPAITKEEAARWAGDLRTNIRCLRRLTKMLKERSK